VFPRHDVFYKFLESFAELLQRSKTGWYSLLH